jgi:hypothetical protein
LAADVADGGGVVGEEGVLAVRGDQQEEAVVPQVVDAGRTREPAAGSGPAGLGDAVQGDQVAVDAGGRLAFGAREPRGCGR